MDSAMDEMKVDNQQPPPQNDENDNNDDDVLIDDTPQFVDLNDAVEVNVDDGDVPMDDDDDDEEEGNMVDGRNSAEASAGQGGVSPTNAVPIVDMSKFKIDSHTDSVYAVACSYENNQLSVLTGGGDDKAFLHKISPDTTTTTASQQLTYNHTDTVSCVAFNAKFVTADLKKTPRLAAVGSYDGSILLYDPDSGEQKLKLEGPSDVEWLCFHPKGGSVLLAGSGDGTVWMFHIPLNRCLQVFVGHEQAVTTGCFSPDGKSAISASADGTLRIWAPKTGMSKHVFRLGEAGLTCMANNGGTDGMLVAVGAEDGQAHVCHIATKKTVASLRHFDPPVGMNEDDDAMADLPMSVEAVGFSPAQPNWCATAGVDGKLKIWDLSKDGQCRHVCKPDTDGGDGSYDSITRLRWHPTHPIIFTSTIAGVVRVWDARNGMLLHTVTGHTEMINDMDIHFIENNGSAVIVSGGDDKSIRVFDVDVNAIMAAASS